MEDDSTVNGIKKGSPVITKKRTREYVVPEGAPTSKPNPVIKSRQTHVKHNPHTYAKPDSSYKPKTNPLEEQIERFQRSEFGRELGYSDSDLASIIKENPTTAKELFIKMKDNDRYGMSELKSLGGASEHYEQEHESVVSYHNLGTTSNPLDIMAGRMSGKDVTGLHSFVEHAERAKDILSSGVGMNAFSEDPAEVIAYGAREKGIDLGGLTNRLKSSDAFKFSDVKEVAGVRNSTQAMTVFRAMTGEDLSQQQVDKADLITPQLYKDASSDKFIQDAVKVTNAFNRITDYYINPLELNKDSGLGENADLESTRRRVQNYLERELPSQVTNQAIHLAQSGKGAWADALPHPDAVAAHLSKSKFGSKYAPYLRTSAGVDELSSLGVSPDEILKASDFKEELKTIQRAFKASNEGGLKHTFDPDMRSNVHELDAMSRLGDDHSSMYEVGSAQSNYVDPITGIRSESFEDYIKSDSTEALAEVYESLGIQRDTLDYRDDSNIPPTSKAEKAAVRDALSRLEEQGELDLSTNISPDKKGKDGFLAATTIDPSPVASSVGISNPIAPTSQGPQPWPSLKPPNYSPNYSSTGAPSGTYSNNGERFVDLRTAKEYLQGTPKDIEANRRKQEAFFSANPNLSFLSNDDDKHEAGSVWHQKRQGVLGSSSVPSLTNPKKSGSLIKGLFKDALKTEEEKFFKPDPTDFNINFSAGDALEEQGIGWYKANVDDSIFEPGMLKSNDPAKRGQSTTPDAMTEDGKKVVEFKSAQYLSDPYADPSTQEGRNQRQQWQTYYAQLQHQMYMTGAKSGDIVQMMKDPLNPHLPDGGKFTSDNIQRKSFDRDEDYIKRMKPVWEQLGQSADTLSGLDPSVQKSMAKAVSEGNIDAFEKLSKRHGIDADGSIRDSLFGGDPKRGGGGGSGGGGSYGGLSGAHSPSALGAIRGIASMHPAGRIANVVLGLGKAVYDTVDSSNTDLLDLAANARRAGYSDEEMFRKSRDEVGRGRYVSPQDAISDVTSLTLAMGGLQTGHTSRAVNMVTATRGAISFEDIYNLDTDNPEAVKNLAEQTEGKLRGQGHSSFAIAAMMEQAGLKSFLAVDDPSMEGRQEINAGIVKVNSTIESVKKDTIGAIGVAGGNIVDAINSIYEVLTEKPQSNSVAEAVETNKQLQIEGGIDADGNVVEPNSYEPPPHISTMGLEVPTTQGYTSNYNMSKVEKANQRLRRKREQERADKAEIYELMNRPAQLDLEDPQAIFNEDNFERIANYMNPENALAAAQESKSIMDSADANLIQALNSLGASLKEQAGDSKVALTIKSVVGGHEVIATDEDGRVISKTKAMH